MILLAAISSLCIALLGSAQQGAPTIATPPPEVVTHQFGSALVAGEAGKSLRTVLRLDPIEHAIVTASLGVPTMGGDVYPGGPQWRAVAAKGGKFEGDEFVGAYLWFNYESAEERTMLLRASGHSVVYVNGVPRGGDPYGWGFVRLPVRLRRGDNEFLFVCARGSLEASLTTAPSADPWIDLDDATLPDFVVSAATSGVSPAASAESPATGVVAPALSAAGSGSWVAWAGIPIVNPSNEPQEIAIQAVPSGAAGGRFATISGIARVPPLSVLKVPLKLQRSADLGEDCRWTLSLVTAERALSGADPDERERSDDPPLCTVELALKSRSETDVRRVTFISGIDGSVQYYGLLPASESKSPPGLLLSLHGASVEALRQASCYAPAAGRIVVAPTNRRPFGFDWEDWGRVDAFEAMAHAAAMHKIDERRVWLSGHSMGGHGTWQLGAHFPSKFAAIGPSAGWISFFTYSGAPELDERDPLQAIIRRAANPSRTLLLKSNYAQEGVFVLHGDVDDNVPVSEARAMRAELGSFHPDFAYHEQVGASHWWGDQCVDWPPMIRFLTDRSLPFPEEVLAVDFATISPSINATCYWATIAQQVVPLAPSRVHLSLNRESRTVSGSTENVALLGLDLDVDGDGGSLSIMLDGQQLLAPEPDGGDLVWLRKAGSSWSLSNQPQGNEKSPQRGGGFKAVFTNGAVLVVGTHGTTKENLWAAAKARYDAEMFWVRGNGSLRILTDDEYVAIRGTADDPLRNRNAVLYGHGDMNRAWGSLLSDSAFAIRRGEVRMADRVLGGDSLGCVLVYPSQHAADTDSLVGVVAGTGPAGMRLTERMPYFTSGTGYPDFLVMDAETLVTGPRGLRAAGFFSNSWGVGDQDCAFSEHWIKDPNEPQGP